MLWRLRGEDFFFLKKTNLLIKAFWEKKKVKQSCLQNIRLNTATIESTSARPYVALWFYSLKVKEEENLRPVYLQ